jgi:hypothetical protein
MSAARKKSARAKTGKATKSATKPRTSGKPKAKTATAAAARQPMRRTIRGGRSYFFADPAIDKVLNMVVVLGSEVWTLRERLAAMEALHVKRRQLKAGEIDAFEFDARDEERLAAERKEFIDSLFRVLQEQVAETSRSRG